MFVKISQNRAYSMLDNRIPPPAPFIPVVVWYRKNLPVPLKGGSCTAEVEFEFPT